MINHQVSLTSKEGDPDLASQPRSKAEEMYQSNESGDHLALLQLQHPKRRQNHRCKQRDQERHYRGILRERKIENHRHDCCTAP